MQGTSGHLVGSGTAPDPSSLKKGDLGPNGHKQPLPALVALVRLLARDTAERNQIAESKRMNPARQFNAGPSSGSPRRWLTAAEAAERLHLSLRSVRRMIKEGRLTVRRFGRAVRIRPEDVEG